jgi:hypothetical protein
VSGSREILLYEARFSFRLKGRTHRDLDRLRAEARRRMQPDELAAATLTNVAEDDLFAAVIDR